HRPPPLPTYLRTLSRPRRSRAPLPRPSARAAPLARRSPRPARGSGPPSAEAGQLRRRGRLTVGIERWQLADFRPVGQVPSILGGGGDVGIVLAIAISDSSPIPDGRDRTP